MKTAQFMRPDSPIAEGKL